MRSSELEVRFDVPRRVDRTLFYQRYYLNGLDAVARLRWEHEPLALRLARGVDAKIALERKLQPVLTRLRTPRTTAHVGRYVTSGGVRFAIDAHDAREIASPEALEESDVYFKSNHWPDYDYPANVVPIVNGNGLIGAREIAHLRALRDRPKDIDVVFVSRVWGGREHNLRLFEQLASVGANSVLHAIFPPGTPPEEAREGMRRLADLGVRVSEQDIPLEELWESMSRARIVFVRAGKYLCVPWRMIDMLCLGTAMIVDSAFRPQWPVPLVPGLNYVDCGLERPEDTTPAPADQYAGIGDVLTASLHDERRLDEMRMANARYFDEHAAPERVGAYLAATIGA